MVTVVVVVRGWWKEGKGGLKRYSELKVYDIDDNVGRNEKYFSLKIMLRTFVKWYVTNVMPFLFDRPYKNR